MDFLHVILWGGAAIGSLMAITVCLCFFCYLARKEADNIAEKIVVTLIGLTLALLLFCMFAYACAACFGYVAIE